MQKYQDVVTIIGPPGLIPIVGANVTVYNHGTSNAAAIFSNNSSTVTANPLTTDSSGRYYFYAADGRYDLQISGTSIQTTTLTDIELSDTTPNLANILAASSGSSLVGFIQSGTGAVATNQREVNERTPSVFDSFSDAQRADVLAGTAAVSVTSAIATAITNTPVGGSLRFPYGTYLGVISVRRSDITLIFEGCTIKHPAGASSIVLELGDTASGNGAMAYENINVLGRVLLDGNKANVTAPTDDLTGWGFIATKISKSEWHVRAKNCHNGGFGAAIDSNDNFGTVYVESCGNASHTSPGFDINSSKRNNFKFLSRDCHGGGRVLDNCYGNQIEGSVYNTTAIGFVYNNQSVNYSNDNSINVTVDTAGSHGVVVGPNCRNSNLDFTVKDAADCGLSMAVQTPIAKTFNGASAGVVDLTANTITVTSHGFVPFAEFIYDAGGGTAIAPLTAGETYYVISVDANTVKLATTRANAQASTAIDLTVLGVGTSHTLTQDSSACGNIIRLSTKRSANQGVLLGGNGNILIHNSYLDGRSGAVGANYAVDVNGDKNTLYVNLTDSTAWHVRGITFRLGADDNELASYNFTGTLDPYQDLGLRTKLNPSAMANIYLTREAADHLGLRDGTTAQKFSIYNTWTDASNYERVSYFWSSNIGKVEIEQAGTGTTTRALSLGTTGAGAVVLRTNATDRWFVGGSDGAICGNIDNTYDIGRTGAVRPRSLFLGTNITTGTPSGGTAAAWKLGTVAVVSPTAQNRTIEVEVGGTTYYLSAKTTNN